MSDDIYKKNFSRNLRYYMNRYSKTQTDIINDLGINKSAISTWVNGTRLPRMDKVDLLANYFNVTRSDLIDEHNYSSKPVRGNGFIINVVGRVAAGSPLEAIEEVIDTEEISEEMAKTGEFFGLKIKGDSMEPRIYSGDVVIVRKQEDAESGDIVIAMVSNDDAVCKRLVKYASSIALMSLNSKYEPMVFTQEEVVSKPVRVIGKVVELRGKL